MSKMSYFWNVEKLIINLMKSIRLLLFVLIGLSHFGCERDDICPENTPTTPRLIIDLYDFVIQEEQKNVFDFRVQGIDNDKR